MVEEVFDVEVAFVFGVGGTTHKNVFAPMVEEEEGFGSGHHVEGNRQSASVVYVVHPQACSRKLPLHVTVSLWWMDHCVSHCKLFRC